MSRYLFPPMFEHRQIADLVYCAEGCFQFGPMIKSVLLNHLPPAPQRLIGLRVLDSEGPQCTVADDFHERNVSRLEILASCTFLYARKRAHNSPELNLPATEIFSVRL